jgi:hypothetical protein
MTTVQNLMDWTRNRTSTVNDQSITDDELMGYVLGSAKFLDNEIIALYEDYKLSIYQAAIVNGQNTIPLPGNFFKLRAVDFNGGQSAPVNGSPNQFQWYTIYSFMLSERNRFNSPLSAAMWPYLFPVLAARVQDQVLMIEPGQWAQGYYQIWYTPAFPELTATSSIPRYMDVQSVYDWILADASAKIFTKFGLDPSGFYMAADRCMQSIVKTFKNRDSGSPKHVVNTRFANDPYMCGGGFDY